MWAYNLLVVPPPPKNITKRAQMFGQKMVGENSVECNKISMIIPEQ